jgi:hypothetical protein
MPASSTVYYHATTTCNVARIMCEGLHPRRGPRSRRLGELHKAVYLFKEREDAADGLEWQWYSCMRRCGEPVLSRHCLIRFSAP